MKDYYWITIIVVVVGAFLGFIFGCTTSAQSFHVIVSCDTLQKIDSVNVILDKLTAQPVCDGILLQYSIGPALIWNVDKINDELAKLSLPSIKR